MVIFKVKEVWRPLIIFIMFIFFFVFVACAANFTQNSYKALSVSKTSYDTALSTAGDLYKKGFLDEEQKNEIIEYGNHYKIAHNLAVQALLDYQTTGDLSKKDKYLANMQLASNFLAKMLDYLEPYLQEN
jgi:hypothetical protein